MIFDRLADKIQRYAKVIIALWLIVLLCSSFFAVQAGSVMSYNVNDMAPTDSESYKGLVVLAEEYPASAADASTLPILVLYYTNETEMKAAQDFAEELSLAALNPEGYGLDPEKCKHISLVMSMDPSTAADNKGVIMSIIKLDTSDIPAKDLRMDQLTPEVRDFVNGVAKYVSFNGAHYVTGMAAIAFDMSNNAMEDISKIDPFTILMILVLVGLFFRSFVSSGAPPMVIGIAFIIAMAAIFGLGQFLNIFFITNMMILVAMMGAGCDYCIFIIARYREELRSGKTHEDALHESVVWAGESITISGAAVIIGFGSMAICSYSMISTMGICLAVGIIIALIAALTLVPSILAVVGDKIFWPTTMKAFKEGGKATKGWYAWFGRRGQSYFHKSANFSLKHAGAIAIAAILVTAPAAYVVAESETSYDMISSMLTGEAGEGMQKISTYADQGMVMPDFVLIEYNKAVAEVTGPGEGELFGSLVWTDYWNDTVYPSLSEIYTGVLKDDNIAYVQLPFVWATVLKLIDDAGITDTDKKIEFVKSVVSAKYAMYFGALVEIFDSTEGLEKSYLFDGPGAMITKNVEGIEKLFASVNFDWDKAVAEAKATGLKDTNEIIEYVANNARTGEGSELVSGTINSIVDAVAETLEAMGLDNGKNYLVNGFASDIEKAVYWEGQKYQLEIEIDWAKEVAAAKAKGLTDSNAIVNSIAEKIGTLDQGDMKKQIFLGVIMGMNAQGLTNDLLVYGFGSYVNTAFTEFVASIAGMTVDWNKEVADAKALGLTDPDAIIEQIETSYTEREGPTKGAILTAVITGMSASGLTSDVLVDGFGPVIDYIINTYDSMIGGEFVSDKEKAGSGSANYIKLAISTKAAGMSNRSMQSISVINEVVDKYSADHKSDVKQTWNTGTSVLMYDVSNTIKEQFIVIEIILVILIIILLFVVMRSYLIPIRSILTILMSIVWTLAVTQLLFHDVMGYDILWMIPLILLVLCLGLGMDYDILLTTRIKENVMDKGLSNDEAIYNAVNHTGSVITICGLIMGGAFGTLMLSSMPLLQMIGFALCFAILVDALIVRTYIVPAIMHLLGDWNWKGPGYKKKMQKFGRS